MPMPDAAPVTMARRSLRSMPASTSAAVDSAVKGVIRRMVVIISCSLKGIEGTLSNVKRKALNDGSRQPGELVSFTYFFN